jgi:arabinofuranosyltransferase
MTVMKLLKDKPAFCDPRLRKVLWLLFGVYALEIIVTAWMCDDAFIAYGTAWQFWNGNGLVYNVGERVQSYTNPLMLFCMIIVSGITREGYFSSLFINIVTSLIAVWLVAFKLPRGNESSELTWDAVIPILILIFSKSFVFFSTSGLENSLEFMLLALFCLQIFKEETWTKKRLFFLALTASLLLLARYDMLLLVLPTLCYVFFRKALKDGVKLRHSFLYGFLGVLPFVAWEVFSLIYYGFLFPNTAYAKLNSGIPTTEYIWRGVEYIFACLTYDAVGMTAIVVALLLAISSFATQRERERERILYMQYV